MDSEIIAIIDQVFEKHKAALSIGLNWEYGYLFKRRGGRYLAILRAGNVGYQYSSMTAGFTSGNPIDALRQAVEYADAHAVSEDEDE